MAPVPVANSLVSSRMTLEAHVWNVPALARQVLAAPEFRRHVRNLQIGEEIVFVCFVTHRPDQARRSCFRLYFKAELGAPFLSSGVAHVELWAGAMHVFLEKFNRRLRLMLFAPRPPVEVQ